MYVEGCGQRGVCRAIFASSPLNCPISAPGTALARFNRMIRKLGTGEYRLYSRKLDPKTKRRRNLGTFKTRAAAEKHERAVQYFKRH
jgi:hypothetical protein